MEKNPSRTPVVQGSAVLQRSFLLHGSCLYGRVGRREVGKCHLSMQGWKHKPTGKRFLCCTLLVSPLPSLTKPYFPFPLLFKSVPPPLCPASATLAPWLLFLLKVTPGFSHTNRCCSSRPHPPRLLVWFLLLHFPS